MAEKEIKPSKKRAARVRKRRETIPSTAPTWTAPFKVICSECYDEFVVTPKEGIEGMTCPSCDHGAKAPSEEFLRKLGHYKRLERKKLILAIAFFAVMFLLGLLWLFLMVNEAAYIGNTAMHYALLGAVVLCFVLVIYFAAGYESSKYDVYF
jgi:hypothetical protein